MRTNDLIEADMDTPMESGLPLYRAEQVRELDRIAIEMAGIPGYTLMSRAGEVAFETLRSTWPEARRLAVVCGTGNNGGDGYVVGRLALEAGMDAIALQLGDSQRIRGDARTALEDFLSVGGTVSGFDQSVFRDVDVIVDAMLGTGLERPLEGEWREAVEALNRVVEPVLAVDIPTGLHADTGMVLGSAVMAACTVTFIGRKQGLFTGQDPFRALGGFQEIGLFKGMLIGFMCRPGIKNIWYDFLFAGTCEKEKKE